MKDIKILNHEYSIVDGTRCLRNPNHKFQIHKYMRDDDKIFFDEEIGDERIVVRTCHDRFNMKFLEIKTLYYCVLCNEWCNYKVEQGKSMRIPINSFKKIFNSLIKRYS